MTKNQRKAVIELKQQHKQQNEDGNKSTGISQVTMDDMITLGDAIVAGVQKASADSAVTETDDDATASGNSQAGRVTAASGSVGSAFKNRMNNKRQKQN